jgi:RNA-directed DNA polymerase
MARAMLAGGGGAAGLLARLRQCLGGIDAAPWLTELARRAAAVPREHWGRLDVRTLGTWVEHDAGFVQAWAGPARPEARRWILRPPEQMLRPPLGLHEVPLPPLNHSGALAQWLGLSPAALWRLSKPAAWQRRDAPAAQHWRFALHAKRRGGWRLIETPEPHLKALQRRLLHGLLDTVPPHEAAFGFVRGRSVREHAAHHQGQPVVLAFDLRDFFGSIPASRVHALFATLGCPHEVARQLAALVTVATPEPWLRRLHEAGQIEWHQLQRLRSPHLPQGAPTSPALANLCAFGLDLRLQGLAETLGARYSRYADDIVISGPTSLREQLPRVRRWVEFIAAGEGYTLNAAKTRCTAHGGQQRVCGIVVNQHPNLPRREFDRLKATLHRCRVNGPAAENRERIAHWREHLQGRVAWAAQLNPGKAARLQALLLRIDWSR